MNLSADFSSIVTAANTLNMGSRNSIIHAASAPSLTGYSPVPSMQAVALEHGNAIAASPGNSIKVSNALLREMEWAATNLRSLATVINVHEENMATNFKKINPTTGANQLTAGTETVAGTFLRRPPFNPGFLTFSPVAVTSELAQDASTLLNMFASTNDSAVGAAIAYWSTYAADMTAIAGEIAGIVGELLVSNQGEVFSAAAASLTGMAGKATKIASSAGIMASHLEVLPAVKAMAVNTLSSIEAQSAAMKDPALKEAFERSEIAAFLNGPYVSQLQAAVPTIPNLTSPDAGGGIGSIAQAGASASGLGGTAQIGLSPQGMTGSVQAGTTPAASQSTMPQSPTSMAPGSGHTSPAQGTTATTPSIPGSSAPASPGTGSAPTTSATTPGGINAMAAPAGASSSPSRTSTAAAPHTNRMSNGSNGGTNTSRSNTGMGSPRGIVSGSRLSVPSATSGSGVNARTATGTPGTSTRTGAGVGSRVLSGAANQKPSSLVAGGNSNANRPQAGAAASGQKSSSTKPGSIHSGLAAAMRRSTLSNTNGAGNGIDAAGGERREANVRAISNNASYFEQDEYQRELFGDEPATVPAVIGANVRG